MPTFKNANNVWYTRGLFFETSEDSSTAVYTLKEQDHTIHGVTYPSLHRLYLEADDPTEYNFALTHLGGWSHWRDLLLCNWFKPYASKWRYELELRMKAKALANIRQMAEGSGREKFAANKFVVEKGWEPKEGQTKRGRPTKEEINAEAKTQADLLKKINADAEKFLQ